MNGKKLSRRAFLRLALSGLTLTGISSPVGFYGFQVEPHGLVVEQTLVKLKNLPLDLNPLIVGQLTDMHVGPQMDASQTARAADLLMQYKPDLIVLTGDFISKSATYAASCIAALAKLSAPLGIFAVLGNHEYWVGYLDETLARFQHTNIRMLRNENVMIGQGNQRIALIGVDDVWLNRASLPLAMAGVSPEACKIALVHEPDYVDEATKYGVDLQISGHSHGGQVRLPWIGAPLLPWLGTKYPYGLRRVNATTQVYTSRGVGMAGLQVRFNCPPEVTVLRLQRG